MAITTSGLKEQMRRAFKKEFPDDTVDVSEDEHGHFQVLVVSRRFDGMAEQDKQDMMWRIIDDMVLRRKRS